MSITATLAQNPTYGNSSSTIVRYLRPVEKETPAATSTLLYNQQSPPPWHEPVLRQIHGMISRSAHVDMPSVQWCIYFLSILPYRMPEPAVAIGDDGSIGVEWDKATERLYVSFAASVREFYWCDGAGNEWEFSLPKGADKLADAVLSLSNYRR